MNRTIAHSGLEAWTRRFGLAVCVAVPLTGCGADDPLVEPPVGFLAVSNATTGGRSIRTATASASTKAPQSPWRSTTPWPP